MNSKTAKDTMMPTARSLVSWLACDEASDTKDSEAEMSAAPMSLKLEKVSLVGWSDRSGCCSWERRD
jgi:hypothetical protein